MAKSKKYTGRDKISQAVFQNVTDELGRLNADEIPQRCPNYSIRWWLI